MKISKRMAPIGAIALLAGALGGCANTGGLGSILGSVLGGGGGSQSSQVTGMVRSVDTRYQQISIQQSDGRTVPVTYDNQTQVVYQNRNYPVTSLEYGDQVTARIQNTNNNGYYTDLVQVDQSATNSTNNGASTSNVQSFQGVVRQVDRTNGLFSMDTNNSGRVTVSLPYRPSNTDLNRFQNLRNGDYVRLYGVLVNNSRVELRQFY